MKPDAADNSVPREISALLSKERLILRETGRAVTPLGGVAVFVAFLHQLGLVEKLRQHMPIEWKSPNQIDPTTTFTAFLMAVLAGAKRFAHASWLRNDRALHALLGLSRFPTNDAIRNLRRRFLPAASEVSRDVPLVSAAKTMPATPWANPKRDRAGPESKRSAPGLEQMSRAPDPGRPSWITYDMAITGPCATPWTRPKKYS